jgi:hypothetical protein
MPKRKLFTMVGLAALLVLVSALAFMARANSGASVAQVSSDPDLEVPAANMSLSGNWQAKPAAGAPVSLGFNNVRVNTDGSQEAQNEPFVAVDPSNSKHMVVGANNWLPGNGHYEVFAYVTFDGGATWAASQPYINRNASRINAADPTVAFGRNGEVYFAFVALNPAQGAVAVSRSNDGGLTWASQSWATSFTGAADKPAIAAGNGALYLYFQNGSLLGSVSRDGGATWSSANTVDSVGSNAAPVVSGNTVNVFYVSNGNIRLARSTDGASYSISKVTSVVPLQPRPTHYRASIYPAAGVDASGNLYVAWADGRNLGHGNDILYTHSVNGGNAWSAPITVNSDRGSADQLLPSLAVGRDGSVTVAWLDNRNDAANYNYDVYLAHSTNGASFGANQRVTNVSSNPDNDPRTQGTMIGDYFALGAGDGVAHAFWTDTRNGNEDIYSAAVPLVAPAATGSQK